jgi:hypothetical protein
MTADVSDSASLSRLLRAVALFGVAQALLVAAAAWGLQRYVWTDWAGGSAVRASGWLAVVVQCFTFAIARLVARRQVIAGWGVGVLLRFAVVAAWALVGASALGLPGAPALLSLVLFLFLSTLLEPLFLQL